MKKAILLFSACYLFSGIQAQSFIGYNNSHYAGIYGVLTNPASMAKSPYQYDVNIIGADLKAGNTYYRISKKAIFSNDTLYLGKDVVNDSGAIRHQYAWLQTDVIGPSGFLQFSADQAAGLIIRFRTQLNFDDLSTPSANFAYTGFKDSTMLNQVMQESYVAAAGHAWTEIGIAYAKVLYKSYPHLLKGGITFKFLGGQQSAYVVARNIAYRFDRPDSITFLSGSLHAGFDQGMQNNTGFQLNNFSFKNLGIGADIGLIYEWRPESPDEEASLLPAPAKDGTDLPYTLRIGVSVTDIGGIRYPPSASNRNLYTNKPVRVPYDSLKYRFGETLVNYNYRLNGYFQSTDTVAHSYYMSLPTVLHLYADYAFTKKLFLNFNASVSLTGGKTRDAKTHYISTFNLTPRIEGRWAAAYLPITFNTQNQLAVGIAGRIGPLVFGSGSLLSNLLSKLVRQGDFYIGLRFIPFSLFKHDGNRMGRFFLTEKQKKLYKSLDCPRY